jgi:hypothetical protein
MALVVQVQSRSRLGANTAAMGTRLPCFGLRDGISTSRTFASAEAQANPLPEMRAVSTTQAGCRVNIEISFYDDPVDVGIGFGSPPNPPQSAA